MANPPGFSGSLNLLGQGNIGAHDFVQHFNEAEVMRSALVAMRIREMHGLCGIATGHDIPLAHVAEMRRKIA